MRCGMRYETDFAITNSGGLRADLTCPAAGGGAGFCPAAAQPPYLITRGKVLDVLPFGNVAATVTINGAELKAFLENGVSQMPAANGRFPQVSGLCFTYNVEAAAGSRVTSVVRQAADGSCSATVVDLTAGSSYSIAENDFMASGGDCVSRDERQARLRDPGHHGPGPRRLRHRQLAARSVRQRVAERPHQLLRPEPGRRQQLPAADGVAPDPVGSVALASLRRIGGGPHWAAAAAFVPIVLGFVLAAWVATARPALGHEGGPRLILEPNQVNPGGVLTIRVEDLPPERMVVLSMAGAAGSVDLATVEVDPEGHATVFVEVPVDIERGTYTVNGEAEGVVVGGIQVVVEGPALGQGGEPGEKDEDDLLLVELPPGWQQSLSGPIITARPLTETLPAGSGNRIAIEGAVIAIALVVGLGSIGVVLGTRMRRRA